MLALAACRQPDIVLLDCDEVFCLEAVPDLLTVAERARVIVL